MALTNEDLVKLDKMMKNNIAEVLEDVVHPRLVEMETSLANKITTEIKGLKKEIKEVESRLTTRIDNIAKIVTETKTNHEKRITRLESHNSLFAS